MLFCSWDFPGKNTGVDCHALLQEIFLTQESNLSLLCLLGCRQILHPLAPLVVPLITAHGFSGQCNLEHNVLTRCPPTSTLMADAVIFPE